MQVSRYGGVLLLVGALDVRGVAEARDAVTALMDQTPGDVVVDVSGVESVDVTGLGMLAAAHRRAEREDRQLLLRGCSGSLRRVLAKTRLDHVLHLEPQHLPV